MEDFERLLSVNALQTILAEHGPLPRGRAQISGAELLMGLVYHVSQPQGTLAAHLHALTGQKISDSAASQRRLTMPWEVFEAILAQALAPLADPKRQPEAFYAGLRLVGIDGTQFSCANTPRVLGTMTKAATRRFEAAFAKLGCAVLVELGTHAPLAAAISAPDLAESEAALAAQLLGRLPAESLLLGDRLYGNGAFLGRLLADAPAGDRQAFLLRVSQTPRPQPVRRLTDGSVLVEVRLAREEAKGLSGQTLVVREIRGRVRRPGGAWSEVRLWTSLLDAKVHPALKLLGLYARRWEGDRLPRTQSGPARQRRLSPGQPHPGYRRPGDRGFAGSDGDGGPRSAANRPDRWGRCLAGELRAHPGGLAAVVDALERGRRPAQRQPAAGLRRPRAQTFDGPGVVAQAPGTRLSKNGAPADQGLAANDKHSRAQRRLAVRVINKGSLNPFTAL